MTLYFNNAVDQAAATLGNWWTDEACSTPSARLPANGDDIICVPFSWMATWGLDIQPASLTVLGTIDCDVSALTCLVTIGSPTVNGVAYTSARFNKARWRGNSQNQAQYTAEGEWLETADNNEGCEVGIGIFRNSSANDGLVYVGQMLDSSNNEGIIERLLMPATYTGGAWVLQRPQLGGAIYSVEVTGIGVVPSAADVRAGTAVGVSPAVGTCAVPAASDVRLGVAVSATTGSLLTYTDPARSGTMPTEHTIAFTESLEEFGVSYTFDGFTFLCIESDASQSLEPVLEGDFHNDSVPIIALKTAFNDSPSGTPVIGSILADPDGREFRVKGLRTSQDDVTIQFDLTDIHDRG